MSDHTHVVCGHCDAVVRTPSDKLDQKPRCPRCRQVLFAGHPIELRSANFDQHVTRNEVPVIVDFWAPWCGPCQAMAPRFEQAAQQFEPHARFAKVNSDEEPSVSARFGIASKIRSIFAAVVIQVSPPVPCHQCRLRLSKKCMVL